MTPKLAALAILLVAAAGGACTDDNKILGSGSELTKMPCSSCAPDSRPNLSCPSDRAPRCFQRTNGTCGWERTCAEPAPTSTPCGGIAGLGCPSGEYCNYPVAAKCGAADQTGTCAPVPAACDLAYSPVCGCDGKTYGNACAAAAASVSVVATGACPTADAGTDAGTAPKTCGGIAGATCATGEYCNFAIAAQCGAADQTGTCTPVPAACDLSYSPVCGCDGKTYSNPCLAAARGVSVAASGECPSTPGGKTCGGIAGLTCAKGEFCNYPIAAQCGAADQTGTCATVPTACTKEYAPVCGCDGKTYGNACTAAAASVSVSATGECASNPGTKTCGGIAGIACPANQYCNYPIAAKCGAADQTGTCATKPDGCTLEYNPVCGCDGKTHGNACSAASAGVSISSTGACP